jgi:hypothetical protein
MVSLTAQTQSFRSRISLYISLFLFCLCLAASLVDGPAHEIFRDEVGVKIPHTA